MDIMSSIFAFQGEAAKNTGQFVMSPERFEPLDVTFFPKRTDDPKYSGFICYMGKNKTGIYDASYSQPG